MYNTDWRWRSCMCTVAKQNVLENILIHIKRKNTLRSVSKKYTFGTDEKDVRNKSTERKRLFNRY